MASEMTNVGCAMTCSGITDETVAEIRPDAFTSNYATFSISQTHQTTKSIASIVATMHTSGLRAESALSARSRVAMRAARPIGAYCTPLGVAGRTLPLPRLSLSL